MIARKGVGLRVGADVTLGTGVKLFGHVNLYGCEIGDHTRIGCFVEIQASAKVGARCKISSHTFICAGVTIEDEVFVGHGVMFANDRWPRATADDGRLAAEGDWQCLSTLVQKGASIGSGCTILGGIVIGLVIVGGWYLTGSEMGTQWKEYADFADTKPLRVETQSYTFISAMGDTLRYLMLSLIHISEPTRPY